MRYRNAVKLLDTRLDPHGPSWYKVAINYPGLLLYLGFIVRLASRVRYLRGADSVCYSVRHICRYLDTMRTFDIGFLAKAAMAGMRTFSVCSKVVTIVKGGW